MGKVINVLQAWSVAGAVALLLSLALPAIAAPADKDAPPEKGAAPEASEPKDADKSKEEAKPDETPPPDAKAEEAPPAGAMYGFVGVDTKELPDFDDQKFALDLLEQKHVLIAPGVSFNVPYRTHFRVTNLPDEAVLRDVFARMEELLSTYASTSRKPGEGKVVDAGNRFK